MMTTLSFSDYPAHVDQIVHAALQAADPTTAVSTHLKRMGNTLILGDHSFNLDQGRVFIVSVGKAALPMAQAAVELLGDDLTAAVIIAKKGGGDWRLKIGQQLFVSDRSSIRVFEGGHPVSDEDSVTATAAVADLLTQTNSRDLVLCLISGGASALLTQPLVSLTDWQALIGALLASGCTINELNSVRIQLDRIKGGGLARLAAPATCASLILSDVVGNPLEAIGSGPTVLVDKSPSIAHAILNRYGVGKALPISVYERIAQALANQPEEIGVDNGRLFYHIVGDVRQAAMAALTKAAQLGFVGQILTARLEGEAREVGRVAASIAKDTPPGRCIILGGETTVTLRGNGFGGRNQEIALAAAVALEGWPKTVVFTLATDGEDGPTDAAGAMVTGETAENGRFHNLDPLAYLSNNDSYTFFHQLDQAIGAAPHHLRPGSTGTNVNDLLLILTYPDSP